MAWGARNLIATQAKRRRRTRRSSATRPSTPTLPIDATARGALASLELALGRDDAAADAAARDACSPSLKVYGLAGEEVAGLDGDLDAVLRTLRAARGARSTLESTNALETTTASVRKAKADVEARCLEATVEIRATPSPGGAFLAAALGLSNATVIEADVVYDLDNLATAVTLEALRVDGRALEAPGFYKWASAARAALAPACVEINQRRSVDGVGRPKFDFHTGPGGAEAEPGATTGKDDRRARRRRHPQSGGRAARITGHAHRRRIKCRRVAGPRRRRRGRRRDGRAGALVPRRRALGDSLRAAKALLALGPTATCAVERVCIERDRSLVVKMTLARPALPDIVLVVRLTVDGSINAIDATSVTVGGAELSPKALTDALDRARALATARRDLASLFSRGRGLNLCGLCVCLGLCVISFGALHRGQSMLRC